MPDADVLVRHAVHSKLGGFIITNVIIGDANEIIAFVGGKAMRYSTLFCCILTATARWWPNGQVLSEDTSTWISVASALKKNGITVLPDDSVRPIAESLVREAANNGGKKGISELITTIEDAHASLEKVVLN